MAKPLRPEPKHFLNDNAYSLGLDFYLKTYFENVGDGVLCVGEKGTSYLEYSFVAHRIYSFFKDAKILVILRNPVSRALSNYYFSVTNGLETRTLEDVFIEKLQPPALTTQTSVSPFNYLQRGHYLDFIKPYFEIFKQNLSILIFEEFLNNADSIKSVYDFLQVESTFLPPSINKKINEGEYFLEQNETRVRNVLRNYFAPEVEKLELFLSRKIESWHD